MAGIRDRIKELRRVKASELIPHDSNWRKHPASQIEAIAGSLDEIGWADVAIAYETEKGLVLIDGHARASVDLNAMVPVVVLDVNEEEARKLLATLDPMAALAQTDQGLLDDLIGGLDMENESMDSLIESLATKVAVPVEPPAAFPEVGDDLETDHECPKCGFKFSGGK